MNPFFFPPRQIPNPESAVFVMGLYDHEIAGAVAQIKQLREQLDAIANVLKEKHPDLFADFDLLIETAINVGHLQGTREDLDIIKSQFRASLPVAIKKALEQPSQP
jgi:hypothetical protein